MAASEKVYIILTKHSGASIGGIMWYICKIPKFVRLILWPGGVYTDYAYATTVVITIPYYDSFHESRLYRLIMAMPNEPETFPFLETPGYWITCWLITGWLCKMLRTDGYGNQATVCWKNSCKKSSSETTPKGQGIIQITSYFLSIYWSFLIESSLCWRNSDLWQCWVV